MHAGITCIIIIIIPAFFRAPPTSVQPYLSVIGGAFLLESIINFGARGLHIRNSEVVHYSRIGTPEQ